MPATLTLDTLEGMELDSDQGKTRYVRPGIIRDIGTGDDYKLLFDALEVSGMPANGSALSVDYPNLLLTRRRLHPLGPSTARVELVYETPSIEGYSSWVIRTASRLVSYRTNRVLGGPTQGAEPPPMIRVGYGGGGGTGPGPFRTIGSKPAEIDQLLPLTEVSTTAVHIGTLSLNPRNYCGGVNAETFLDKPRGYWLLAEAGIDSSVYTGYTTSFATLLCRNFDDWCEWAWCTDIDGNVKYSENRYKEVRRLPYAYGLVNLEANSRLDGFARVGPFPTIDMAAVLPGLE